MLHTVTAEGVEAHRWNFLEDKMSSAPKRQNPNEFLKTIVGKPVVVKLNSGTDYRGILSCLDGNRPFSASALFHYQTFRVYEYCT